MLITLQFDGDGKFEKPQNNILKTQLKVDERALDMADCHQRVINMCEAIGRLTTAKLHATCKELDIDTRIKKTMDTPVGRTFSEAIILQFHNTVKRTGRKRTQIKICYPVEPPPNIRRAYRNPRSTSLTRHLIPLTHPWPQTEEDSIYFETIKQIAEQALMLLNTNSAQMWQCTGYHPLWHDTTLVNTFNRRVSAETKAKKKDEREAKKKAKEPQKEGTPHPKTGAGRTFGAVPGKFKGVQMRSQLEIRLAAELEERGIKWIYEEERLGEGNYLVDFHLPDLKCWIEAKGKFDARDKFLLREVAEMLKTERGEKLYAYTSRRGYIITKDDFTSMKHSEFWELLQHES